MTHTERAALALELAAMLEARTNDRLCSDSAMMLRFLAQMLESDLAQFANAFLDPEDLGYAVSPGIRDRARLALGMKVVEGGEG